MTLAQIVRLESDKSSLTSVALLHLDALRLVGIVREMVKESAEDRQDRISGSSDH